MSEQYNTVHWPVFPVEPLAYAEELNQDELLSLVLRMHATPTPCVGIASLSAFVQLTHAVY